MNTKKLITVIAVVFILSAMLCVSAFAFDNLSDLDGDGLYFYGGVLAGPLPSADSEHSVATIFWGSGDMKLILALHSGYSFVGADIWSIGDNALFYSCTYGDDTWTPTTYTKYSLDTLDILYSNVSATSDTGSSISSGTIVPASGSHTTTFITQYDKDYVIEDFGSFPYVHVPISIELEKPMYMLLSVIGQPVIIPVVSYDLTFGEGLIYAFEVLSDELGTDPDNVLALYFSPECVADADMEPGLYVAYYLWQVIGFVEPDAYIEFEPDNNSLVPLGEPVNFDAVLVGSFDGYTDYDLGVYPEEIVTDVTYNFSTSVSITFGENAETPVLVLATFYSDTQFPTFGYSVVYTLEAPPDEGGSDDGDDDPQPPFGVADI